MRMHGPTMLLMVPASRRSSRNCAATAVVTQAMKIFPRKTTTPLTALSAARRMQFRMASRKPQSAHGRWATSILIRHQTVLKDEKGDKLATLVASRFARGDGGFGGPSEGQPEPHKVPERAPDKVVDITTRPDQALIYRLCGDRNPLHSDPEFAKKAGFPRPILHGMCTYGITCRGVLQTYADYDPSAFKQHAARFSSPVFPGETVTMELWKDGNVVSFEAKVKSRGVTVIKSGKTVLA